MTHERWQYTNLYAQSVFDNENAVLKALLHEAEEAGLPDIAVTSEVGQLLAILTSMTSGQLALEIGTLAGYSAMWLMRGMAADGRLITIEQHEGHADFAERQFAKAGLADRVSVRRGPALDLLPAIAGEVGPEMLDVVFIDAEKTEYPAYWRAIRPLVTVGGLVIVDNVFGTGESWIDDASTPGILATDRMNRTIAADEGFMATAIAVQSGLLMAKRI